MNKVFLYTCALLTVASSCTKDFDQYNQDKKRPTEAPAQSLFAHSARELNRQAVTLNVNFNPLKLWSQHLTQTTYTDESNYDLVNRNIPEQEWAEMYRDVLQNLLESENAENRTTYVTPEDIAAQTNRLAVIQIYRVYAYERLISIFGDIPYTQANSNTNLPVFDDSKTVYMDLASKLDNALQSIDEGAGSFDPGFDNMYEGDMMMWKKFGYGIKLKMGILLSDVDPGAAGPMITDAWDKTFSSATEGAYFRFLGSPPNTNPMWEDLVQSGRSDFVASNTMVDYLNNLSDMRMSAFYSNPIPFVYNTDPNTGEKVDTEIPGSGNLMLFYSDGTVSTVTLPHTVPAADSNNTFSFYVGGTYGANNSFAVNSHAGDLLKDPTQPAVLMDYSEIEFYKAEASVKGLGAGDAETHYNNGINASFTMWTGAEDASYLANPDVAFTTAPGTDLEKIALQAWIASFNRGDIGWNTYRRLDAPTLNVAANSGDPIPTRYTYPVNEQTLNSANYQAAANAIGKDTKYQKLWWDIN